MHTSVINNNIIIWDYFIQIPNGHLNILQIQILTSGSCNVLWLHLLDKGILTIQEGKNLVNCAAIFGCALYRQVIFLLQTNAMLITATKLKPK